MIQEIDLPEDEEIVSLHSSPPLISQDANSSPPRSGRSSVVGRIGRDEEDEDYVELPSHTWPHGCIVLTTKSLYICQPRYVCEVYGFEMMLGGFIF